MNIAKSDTLSLPASSARPRHGLTAESSAELVSLYDVPPSDEVTLDEFESLALTRLRGEHAARPCCGAAVLMPSDLLCSAQDDRGTAGAGAQAGAGEGGDGQVLERPCALADRRRILGRAQAACAVVFCNSSDAAARQRKDIISHFVLRLAFCKSEELRRWFLAQECALFRLRLEGLALPALIALMARNNLNFQQVREWSARSARACCSAGAFVRLPVGARG